MNAYRIGGLGWEVPIEIRVNRGSSLGQVPIEVQSHRLAVVGMVPVVLKQERA
jgi:hypothetical protein